MAKTKSSKKATRAGGNKKTARSTKAGRRGTAKRKVKAVPATKKRTARKAATKPNSAATRNAPTKKKRADKSAAAKKSAAKKKTAKRKSATKKIVGKKVVKEIAKKKALAAAKKKTAASVIPLPTRPAPAPIYSSSVIRIKMNAKPKRRASPSRKSKKSQSPEATALDPIQYPEESRRPPKTHLTAKELREFKKLLLRKRTELCGDVQRLTNEAFHKGGDGGKGDHSSMPIHMADLGTDNWEQGFTIDLIDNERSRVVQIDEALHRIEKKTYGVCVATHKKISNARLRAKPWAKYCIEFARAREEGRAY